MNDSKSRTRRLFRPLRTRFSLWWGSSGRAASRRGLDEAAAKARDLRDSETGRKAAARLGDLRESDTAKKAEAKLADLRESDTAKRAEAKLADLRDTDAARKAEAKLADLRQNESVKKAEETARKALSDLFSGSKNGSGHSPN